MNKNNDDTITINATPDRRLIPAEESNERYILLTVKVPERTINQDRLPLNLSLVIDRSGSMSGKKLEYVKEAVTHVLRTLSATDRASVVVYDDEVTLLAPSQRLSSSVRQKMIEQIGAIRSGGTTNLSGGWFLGGQQIAEYFSKDYINRAFLLTDGLANVGLTDHEELVMEAKKFRQRSISTTTFGVGHDFNEFLLQGIADNGNGHFYFIDTPQQIPHYFQGELGEMLTTVAREMTVDLTLPEGGTAQVVNQLNTEPSSRGLRIFLGDGYAGDERKVVLKVTLPPSPLRDIVTIQGHLMYEDVQQRQVVTVTMPEVSFTAVSLNAYHQQAVNQLVLDEAVKMEITEAKMEALKRNRQGRGKEVKGLVSKMRHDLDPFLSQAEIDQNMAELETLADDMEQGMTAQASKAVHYQTHMSRHSRKDYKK